MKRDPIPPFIKAIIAEADQIAPHRRRVSDGTIGDAAHRARRSDHNPGARGLIHAVDLTHDPQGGFDARLLAEYLRQRCALGQERRIKYIVSYDERAGHDVIASPIRGWAWRKKSGNAHRSHIHISIHARVEVEYSTDKLFFRPADEPVTTEDEDTVLIEQPGRTTDPWRPAVAELRRNAFQIILYNGARLREDFPYLHVHVIDLARYNPERVPIVGWFAEHDGVKVVDQLGRAYKFQWV